MKAKTHFMILIALVSGMLTLASAQEQKSKEEARQEQFAQIKQLINEGDFKFEAKRAFPQGGRSIDLTTNYGFITVHTDDRTEGDLPFFGRAYTASYGGDGGIKFKGEMLNKKVVINEKKKKMIVSFEVRDKDTYQVTMDIGYSGSTSVSITSNNRSHISYNGQVVACEAQEETK